MKKIGESIGELFYWVSPGRKFVYYFDEGSSEDRELLGKKGSNLCEMSRLGLPVPSGFVISSEAAVDFRDNSQKLSKSLTEEISKAVKKVELDTGKYFGLEPLPTFPKKTDRNVPLLLSVRADSAVVVPGIMPTVLNLGLNDAIVDSMAKSSNNVQWVYDTYRRFLQMFGCFVMDVPMKRYDVALKALLDRKGLKNEEHMNLSDLIELVMVFKGIADVPGDPWVQLGMAISKMMECWWSESAVKFRELHNIREDLSSAVVIQSMVYGNRNVFSGTGLAYTRNPITGEREICGEYMSKSEGVDLLSGIRTPSSIMELFRDQPGTYEKLVEYCGILEKHFQDLQAVEFTIDGGFLFLLESRTAPRSAEAATRLAVSLVNERIISERNALMRVNPSFLRNHSSLTIDRTLVRSSGLSIRDKLLGSGMSGSHGATSGYLAFSSQQVERQFEESKPSILYQKHALLDEMLDYSKINGLVTLKGGSSSDLASIVRGLGKEIVLSALEIVYDEEKKELRQRSGDVAVKEGELITIDGATGLVYAGELPLKRLHLTHDMQILLTWADRYKTMGVLADASTLDDAKLAIDGNSDGVGVCRLDALLRRKICLPAMRQLLLCDSEEQKRDCAGTLTAALQSEILDLFKVTGSGVVNFAILESSLGTFFPHFFSNDFESAVARVTAEAKIDAASCLEKIRKWNDTNPLLGCRGARVAIAEPLLLEAQVMAIFGAVSEAKELDIHVETTTLVPLVVGSHEASFVIDSLVQHKNSFCRTKGITVESLLVDFGVMISTPRACLHAHKIAQCDNLSTICFDLDTLTQLVLGISENDCSSYMELYLHEHLLGSNPFETLDSKSVGSMLCLAVMKIREANASIRIGALGPQCNDPKSIDFFHKERLDFISCSAVNVPTAKVAAAQSRIREFNDNLQFAMDLMSAEINAF